MLKYINNYYNIITMFDYLTKKKSFILKFNKFI